ncbi:vegetative cell wall protein gp1-like [Xiphophorus hellerii]|uniref:vegetative cell wall protein gp1-like n=1 Tax=Xiphophorus hellerii TaxID=8084 RepID=UPI0013B3B3AC|nr:vegetative cell wall protein gp1-like [Xiphophorus hellerii]
MCELLYRRPSFHQLLPALSPGFRSAMLPGILDFVFLVSSLKSFSHSYLGPQHLPHHHESPSTPSESPSAPSKSPSAPFVSPSAPSSPPSGPSAPLLPPSAPPESLPPSAPPESPRAPESPPLCTSSSLPPSASSSPLSGPRVPPSPLRRHRPPDPPPVAWLLLRRRPPDLHRGVRCCPWSELLRGRPPWVPSPVSPPTLFDVGLWPPAPPLCF